MRPKFFPKHSLLVTQSNECIFYEYKERKVLVEFLCYKERMFEPKKLGQNNHKEEAHILRKSLLYA